MMTVLLEETITAYSDVFPNFALLAEFSVMRKGLPPSLYTPCVSVEKYSVLFVTLSICGVPFIPCMSVSITAVVWYVCTQVCVTRLVLVCSQ